MNPSVWQLDYLLYLQNFRDISNHVFDSFFLNISYFGLQQVTYFIFFGMYWAINKEIGRFMINCYTLSYLFNTFLKFTFCIYRPWLLDSRIHPLDGAYGTATGYSFPSGHTAGVVSCFGSLMISFWKNKILRCFSFLIILLVMLSRNYLGVHTPQDVLISFIVGFIIIFGLQVLFRAIEKNKTIYDIYIAVVFILCILLSIYICTKTYPIDYVDGKILFDPKNIGINKVLRIINVFGITLGCYLEAKFINFNPKIGSIFQKIIRVILGLALFLLIEKYMVLFLNNFLSINLSKSITYFISGLFLTFLYPFFIKLRAK